MSHAFKLSISKETVLTPIPKAADTIKVISSAYLSRLFQFSRRRTWRRSDQFNSYRIRPNLVACTKLQLMISATEETFLLYFVQCVAYYLACLDGAEVSASGLKIWRSNFKSHPRLTSQSWPSYQLNQLGSKAASDSTLKTVDYLPGIKYLYFVLFY